MKYEDTIDLIKSQSELLQQDIYNNPNKYINKNQIDIELIGKKLLRNIKKELTTPWIDESDLNNLIKDKKIKLKVNKSKNNKLLYTLIDKKGNELNIYNQIIGNYRYSQFKVHINIFFLISGNLLDFQYLFNNMNLNIKLDFDISTLLILLKLIGDFKLIDENSYHTIKI